MGHPSGSKSAGQNADPHCRSPRLQLTAAMAKMLFFRRPPAKESSDEGFKTICPHAWSPGPCSAAPGVLDRGGRLASDCFSQRLSGLANPRWCLTRRPKRTQKPYSPADGQVVDGDAAAVYLGAGQAGRHVCAAGLQVRGVRRAGHAHVRRFTAIGLRSAAALASGEVVLALRRGDGPRHGLRSAAAVYGSGERPPVSVSELGRSRPACAACSDRDCSFLASGWSRSAAGPAAS